jgi:hypothetical protein
MERTLAEVTKFLADTFNSNFDNTISCAYQIHSIYLEFLSDQEGTSYTAYIKILDDLLAAYQLCIIQYESVCIVDKLYRTKIRKIPTMMLEEFIGLYDEDQLFITGNNVES